MKLQQQLLSFLFLISSQSVIAGLPVGVAAAHSYRDRTVFNMTAQLYGPGSANVPDPVTVPHGGTGDTSLTQYGVLIGAGVNPVQVTAAGTTGTVLIGSTGANPLFSDDITVSNIATTTGTITAVPVIGTDIVNKDYVDLFVSGLTVKTSCEVATTGALTANYLNGAAGVGATLTNSGAMAALVVDSVSVSLNDRVLVKNQGTTFQNGIYTVTNVGSGATNWILTRATDFDMATEIAPGDLVPVTSGSVNANTLWLQTQTVVAVGVSPILFSIFLQSGIATLQADVGSATGATVTIAGGSNIATSASGSTLTVNVADTTQYAVQVGSAAGALNSISPSVTSGIPLVSQGNAANPAFDTAVVAGGGTGVTSTVAYTPLCGGTNSTAPLQSVASAGSSGQALISGGAGVLPAYGAVGPSGGGTGQTALNTYNVLIGEWTSPIGFAAPGNTGIPLVSTGSASNPAFGTALVLGGGTGVATLTAYALITGGTTTTAPVQSVTVGTPLGQGATNVQALTVTGSSSLPSWTDNTTILTLTAAQIKALHGTPITIVNAPGANKMLYVNYCVTKLNYGTTAFTAAASQTITLNFTGTSGTNIIAAVCSNAQIVSTSSQILGTINGGQDLTAIANVENQPIVLYNPVATEITVGDSTITVLLNYSILSI